MDAALPSPAPSRRRHATVPVRIGRITVGGGAPVVVQSMTNTDTADAIAEHRLVEVHEAGADELVTACPTCSARLSRAGVRAPRGPGEAALRLPREALRSRARDEGP